MTCIHPDLRAVYNNMPENDMVLNAETAVLVRQSIIMPEMAEAGNDPDLVITRLSIPGPAGDIAQFMVQPKPEEGKLYPVVLDIHGGGMFYGTAEDAASLMAEAAKKLGYLYISPEYRLAPEHKYPGALEDGMAVWDHLMQKGYDCDHVLFAGDSAGGNLVLCMTQKLIKERDAIPGCLLLFSPWTDMTATAGSYESRKDRDPILTKDYVTGVRDAYIGSGADPSLDIYSPLNGDFSGFPPTLIMVGENDGWHVYQQMPVPMANRAMKRLSDYVSAVIYT